MLQTVTRAGLVLDLFSAERPEWGATAVAAELGIAKSQAHALLVSLSGIGLLERVRSGRYRLGWRVLALSSIALDTSALRQQAAPAMDALALRYGETIHLAVWREDGAFCIGSSGGRRRDAVPAPPLGAGLAAHCTATGKVLLAGRPASELTSLLERDGFVRLTPHTIVAAPELRRELAGIRGRGFAFDQRESDPATFAVAAPVADASGGVVAAVALTAPGHRWRHGRAEYARAVVAAAGAISRRAS
ncbi:MAG TPA: IclR family transcriptional regulator, partial [Solirubrobacteraceae bacterium]|nr:IclR family transcriptional regulator [Solirubrobacteraceae bacterium]